MNIKTINRTYKKLAFMFVLGYDKVNRVTENINNKEDLINEQSF